MRGATNPQVKACDQRQNVSRQGPIFLQTQKCLVPWSILLEAWSQGQHQHPRLVRTSDAQPHPGPLSLSTSQREPGDRELQGGGAPFSGRPERRCVPWGHGSTPGHPENHHSYSNWTPELREPRGRSPQRPVEEDGEQDKALSPASHLGLPLEPVPAFLLHALTCPEENPLRKFISAGRSAENLGRAESSSTGFCDLPTPPDRLTTAVFYVTLGHCRRHLPFIY